jgi:hypothetical protein
VIFFFCIFHQSINQMQIKYYVFCFFFAGFDGNPYCCLDGIDVLSFMAYWWYFFLTAQHRRRPVADLLSQLNHHGPHMRRAALQGLAEAARADPTIVGGRWKA